VFLAGFSEEEDRAVVAKISYASLFQESRRTPKVMIS
jgi:hypothetical protein